MTACLFTTWLMEYKLIVETHCSEIRFFSKYYHLLTMHLVTQELWWRYILFSCLLTHPFCSSWIKESFQLLSPQFSWVAQPCWTVCDSMDCSMPGFPVHHQLTPKTCSNSCPLSRWCHPTISSSFVPFSHLQSFPASGSFLMSQFFASGGQSIRVSASASILSMNIQDWFPLGWTGWKSLQSKGLSRVFYNTTVQKHQFFGPQLSL